MDRNTLLAIVLSLAVLTLWTMFTTPPKPTQRQRTEAPAPAAPGPSATPSAPAPGATPDLPEAVAEAAPDAERAAPPAPSEVESRGREQISIDTPLFRAELDSLG